MKFNKKEWRGYKLSPNMIVNDTTQTMKLFISDVVSNSPIQSARFKVQATSRADRNTPTDTTTVYIDWTDLTYSQNNDFYEADYIITTTISVGKDIPASLIIEITDEDGIDFIDNIPVTLRGV